MQSPVFPNVIARPVSRLLIPLALTVLTICAPAWLARNVSPSATFYNQALALFGWSVFIGWLVMGTVDRRGIAWKPLAPAVLVPVLLMLGVAISVLFERLPLSLGLSAVGMLMCSLLALIGGVLAARDDEGGQVFKAVCLAMVAAGTVSALLALVQVFAPQMADGEWIARASTPGRAGGNLRQPNHLSSMLLWAMVSLVWTHDALVERNSGPQRACLRMLNAALLVLLTFGVVLTVSRTGTVCVVMLAAWAFFDKQLSRTTRLMLWAVPLFYVAFWFGMLEWSRAGEFAGDVQIHKADPSSSRFGIWSNALALLLSHPWVGVGWGEFNFAWSLTPFPGRPVAFFDHTHNLPLNVLVELGIPLGLLVLGLLAWSLWKAFLACRISPQPQSVMVRSSFVMVLMMAIHSMLEYPLWYAYFLLPTAFALGICLAHSSRREEADGAFAPVSPRLRFALIGASLLLAAGTAFSLFDYQRVTRIFSVDDDDTTSLSYRIAEGQKSVFFAHHADYAAATVATHPSTAWKAFRRAPHLLLDTRLMMAWAKAYAEKGDVERARYIADRLREFRNPDSAEFFAECDKPVPAGMPEPFQCKPATRQFTYEDFKLR